MSHTDTSVVASSKISRMGTALGLMLMLVQSGCESSSGTVTKPEEVKLPTIKVDVATVARHPWAKIVRSQGNLVADERAVVGSKVAGRVAQVHVDLGDFVTNGTPLITLDEEEFRLRVVQAEAQLTQSRSAVGLAADDPIEKLKAENSPPVQEQLASWDEAKANLERMKRLQSQKAVTLAEVEQIAATERVAQARYASALNSTREKIALIGIRQAELALARQQLQDVVIRMPFDGLVQARDVAPGAYVQVGNPVATVVRTDPLRFRGAMAERLSQGLAIGQKVSLKIESLKEPRIVKVARISPALNQMNRSLIFEADVQNEDHQLRAGLFAEAEVFIDPDAQALVVPNTAVVEFAGTEKVWKVVDGRAAEQEILSGERRNDGIEILRGLNEGDVILVDGTQGREANVEAHPVKESSSPPPLEKQANSPAEKGTVNETSGSTTDGSRSVDVAGEADAGGNASARPSPKTVVSE